MTIIDLMKECDKAEAQAHSHGIDDPGFTLKLRRPCRGKTARVLPGLSAEVVFHGDQDHCSIARVACADFRAWAARSEHPMVRCWAALFAPAERAEQIRLIEAAGPR